jgi:hypothetical protein
MNERFKYLFARLQQLKKELAEVRRELLHNHWYYDED